MSLTPSPMNIVPHASNSNNNSSLLDSRYNNHVVDFSTLDEMDPSLVDGHHVFFEREVPFEIRYSSYVNDHDKNDNASSSGRGHPQSRPAGADDDFARDVLEVPGSLEAIKVKILLRGVANCPDSVRVELSSESNLFFHFFHEVNHREYAHLQETQRLVVEFVDYASVLVRMLNCCIKEPHQHLALLSIRQRNVSSSLSVNMDAKLEFIQNMEYKFVELLTINFIASEEEIVRKQITYRYNANKSRLSLLQARLADVNALVKVKNPSLLLQLQRTTTTINNNNTTSPIITSPLMNNNSGSKNTYGKSSMKR